MEIKRQQNKCIDKRKKYVWATNETKKYLFT